MWSDLRRPPASKSEPRGFSSPRTPGGQHARHPRPHRTGLRYGVGGALRDPRTAGTRPNDRARPVPARIPNLTWKVLRKAHKLLGRQARSPQQRRACALIEARMRIDWRAPWGLGARRGASVRVEGPLSALPLPAAQGGGGVSAKSSPGCGCRSSQSPEQERVCAAPQVPREGEGVPG